MSIAGIASCNSANGSGGVAAVAGKSQIGTLQAQLSQLQQKLVITQCKDTQSIITQQITAIQERITALQGSSTSQVAGNVVPNNLAVSGVGGVSNLNSVPAHLSSALIAPTPVSDGASVNASNTAASIRNSTTSVSGNSINIFT